MPVCQRLIHLREALSPPTKHHALVSGLPLRSEHGVTMQIPDGKKGRCLPLNPGSPLAVDSQAILRVK